MSATVAVDRTQGFALGLALSAFDAAATWLWLTLGLATEANPVVATMIETQGLTTAMGMRALLGIVWFGGFAVLTHRTQLAGRAQFTAIGILGALAIYHIGFGAAHLATSNLLG